MIEPTTDYREWYERLKEYSLSNADSVAIDPSLTMDKLDEIALASEQGTQMVRDMEAVLRDCRERLLALGDVADVPFAVVQVAGEEIALPLWLLVTYAAEEASVVADCADIAREAEAAVARGEAAEEE